MNQLIAAKPDLIAITPADPNAIVPSLVKAQKAGIKVLNTIGRLTPAGQKLVVGSVLTDNAALGRFAADNIAEGLKKLGIKTGNVMMLTGTATQLIVQDRVAAFKAAIAKDGYKLVATQDTNWDQQASAKAAQQILAQYKSKGGIQAAYGMADNMAVGIIQGAQQAGVKVGLANKGMIVTGSNCLSVGIQAIQKGQEYGTATQAPLTEATAAAKAAEQVLLGKSIPPVTYVHEDRITQSNVAKFAKLCSF
jgi:ABC-type sugar transport system substrate-binding protein